MKEPIIVIDVHIINISIVSILFILYENINATIVTAINVSIGWVAEAIIVRTMATSDEITCNLSGASSSNLTPSLNFLCPKSTFE